MQAAASQKPPPMDKGVLLQEMHVPVYFQKLHVPVQWQRVDFISDLHLAPQERATFDAWAQHMAHTPADALFILGDLFEVWVGDDTQDPFALQCQQVLRETAKRLPVYFMCGNRDFLVGAQLLAATGVQGLSDPTVLDFGVSSSGRSVPASLLTRLPASDSSQPPTPLRLVLSHGDALCLDDHDYQAFRAQVRQSTWQAEFLAKPLAERQAYARSVRAQSEARKQSSVVPQTAHASSKSANTATPSPSPVTGYADVDSAAARAWLHAAQAQVLLHGHTHLPAEHDLGQGMRRWVLSDWHADAQPPRLEVLCWLRELAHLPAQGLVRQPLA